MLRIGITADWEEVAGKRRQVLNREYFEWLFDAGLVPVALPAVPGSEDHALEGLNGLVLSGGRDISPDFYGGDPEPLPSETFSHRDRTAFEFALVWRSLRINLPVLGICLGCQTLAAALGGDLIRHLEDPRFRHRRRSPEAPPSRHRIRVAGGSLAAALYPSLETRVISSHHQSIGRLPPGWRVTAWGPDDVVEAIECTGHPRAMGIQWHPERSRGSRFSRNLAAWLKRQAEAYRREMDGA